MIHKHSLSAESSFVKVHKIHVQTCPLLMNLFFYEDQDLFGLNLAFSFHSFLSTPISWSSLLASCRISYWWLVVRSLLSYCYSYSTHPSWRSLHNYVLSSIHVLLANSQYPKANCSKWFSHYWKLQPSESNGRRRLLNSKLTRIFMVIMSIEMHELSSRFQHA